MAYLVTPSQHRYNDPAEQVLFQYNTPRSNLYLSKPLNYLFRVFGNNLVITGLDIDSVTMDDNNIVTITITSGSCIVDYVFHEITNLSTLQLDVSPYDDQNSKLIVSANYKFLQTLEYNPLRFKLSCISNDGNTVQPVPWDSTGDKLVIAAFTFDKANNTVTEYTDPVTILGKTYAIRGYDENTSLNFYKLIHASVSTDFGYYYA